MLKRYGLLLLFFALCGGAAQSQEKVFVREYTYTASEDDSKNSAKARATARMRKELLREVGEYLESERKLTRKEGVAAASEDYTETTTAGRGSYESISGVVERAAVLYSGRDAC